MLPFNPFKTISQYVGDMTPFKHWSIGRHSLAQISSCDINLGHDVTVIRGVLNRAAALEAEMHLNLGPPNL